MAVAISLVAVPSLAAIDVQLQELDATVFEIDELPEELPAPDQRSRILAADGSLIGVLVGAENRRIVELEDIPEVMRNAVIATEDAGFYEHAGVDHGAILRALIRNVEAGGVEQGASTITQQYVKNALLSPKQTVGRKLQEVQYAVLVEERFTKDEILERYLNLAYFGNGTYGVAAASEYYFGHPIEEITAGEAALLAGLIRAPERNEPIGNPDAALARRNIVLEQMAINGLLSRAEADAAKAAPIQLEVTPPPAPRHPQFVEFVKQRLLDEPALGETRADRARRLFGGGLRIETTLVPGFQTAAEAAIADHLQDPAADPLGALITLDPGTGAVQAMAVGPKGFGNCDSLSTDPCTLTRVNPIAPGMGGSGRQAGSIFKPVLVAAALEAGVETSQTYVTESEREIEGCGVPGEPWKPANYSEGGRDWMDMVDAVRTSNNVYHAELIAEVGPATVAEMGARLGITTPLPEVCALALGAASVFPLDMAKVFGVFANDGVRCEPLAVTRITDADGDVIFEQQPSCERVIEPEVARTLTAMLENVVSNGTARRASIGRPVAGKTGTTNDWRDAWFAGFVPGHVTVAWVGHEQPTSMTGILGFRRVAGGTVPASMWGAYMGAALDGTEPRELELVRLARGSTPPPEILARIRRQRELERQRQLEEQQRQAEQQPPEQPEAPAPPPQPEGEKGSKKQKNEDD